MIAFSMKSMPRRFRAFTLVELLVVIGIIAVLLAVLLPALQRARFQTQRIQCASNMHQWAIALQAYAANWKGSFPPNDDAVDMSWIGQSMIQFSNEYIGQGLNGFNTSDAAYDNHDHVMYCPTQEWHRYVRENWGWSAGGLELVGYFYFPYRAIPPQNLSNGADYTPAGLSWVLKKKFWANDARNAPLLSDMIQKGGPDWGGPRSLFEPLRKPWQCARRLQFHVRGRPRHLVRLRFDRHRRVGRRQCHLVQGADRTAVDAPEFNSSLTRPAREM